MSEMDMGTIGGEGFADAEPATQEEQEAKDDIVMAGLDFLFDDGEPTQQALKLLKAGEDPSRTMAEYTVNMVTKIDDSLGSNLPEAAIAPAAMELLENVAELAGAAQLFAVDEAVLNQAAQHLVVLLGEEYGTQPDEVQGLLQGAPQEFMAEVEASQGNFGRKTPPQNMKPGMLGEVMNGGATD